MSTNEKRETYVSQKDQLMYASNSGAHHNVVKEFLKEYSPNEINDRLEDLLNASLWWNFNRNLIENNFPAINFMLKLKQVLELQITSHHAEQAGDKIGDSAN